VQLLITRNVSSCLRLCLLFWKDYAGLCSTVRHHHHNHHHHHQIIINKRQNTVCAIDRVGCINICMYICVCVEKERDIETEKATNETKSHIISGIFFFFLCFSFPVRWVNMPPEEQSMGWVFILFWFFFHVGCKRTTRTRNKVVNQIRKDIFCWGAGFFACLTTPQKEKKNNWHLDRT